MKYVYHYNVAALIILIVITLHFYSKKTIYTRATRIFQSLMLVIFVATLSDLISVFTIEYPERFPMWFNYFISILYFGSFNAVALEFFRYLLSINSDNPMTRVLRKIFFIPATISILAVVSTPITKFIFYYDENGVYKQGEYLHINHVASVIYVVITWIYMNLYRKKLTIRQVITLYFYTISAIVALGIQIVTGNVLVLGFALSLSMILMCLSLENPLEFIEKKLDIFNKTAFLEVVHNNISREKKFQVFAVKVDGLKYVKNTFGEKYEELLLKKTTEELIQIMGRNDLFYLGHGTFAVVACLDKDEWIECIEKVTKNFKRKLVVEKMELNIYIYMCMLAYPQTISKYENVMDMIKYSLEEATKSATDEIIYAKDDILLNARKENMIMQLIKESLAENKFEVYYQPIYSVNKKKYTSAEALVRLYDDELGFISPEEFIPMAEKTGLILDIGEYVFREVCKFIKEYKTWELGIEYIDVNLSVVQCMQEKLHETLCNIMDEYDLEYKYINLEITETAAAIFTQNLNNNMNKLIEKGVRFSLDDYGTGYSNIVNLIRYKFYAIKIDKSLLWTAMENNKAMYALKHTIAMVKEMDMKLVVEGVETLEHTELLEKLGCDFFQGYYYSKPIKKELFLDEIKKMNFDEKK